MLVDVKAVGIWTMIMFDGDDQPKYLSSNILKMIFDKRNSQYLVRDLVNAICGGRDVVFRCKSAFVPFYRFSAL